jgi:hypothetical protein
VIDLTSPVWDLMASGRMPDLAELCLHCKQLSWGHCGKGAQGGYRLARALEGVAGTLKRLTLESDILHEDVPVAARHDLGVAIGKMRRLTYLSLCLFADGRAYQAVGRGLAASGGCPPLSELHLDRVQRNIDGIVYETNLIVPSVRRLHIQAFVSASEEDALLLCCGLVQVGYRHGFTHNMHSETYYSCLAAILKAGGIHTYAKQGR